MTEEQARQSKTCPGCGVEKTGNGLVCWDCFKGGKHALKYYQGTFKEWLKLKKQNA